jgi:hypothetical protein
MSGVEQRIKVTFEHPRSWWRRLLRLPARRSERGPYDVRPWVELMETNQGPGRRGQVHDEHLTVDVHADPGG